jgi:hypothetical protein
MYTFWTGQFANDGVGTWSDNNWVALVDPFTDGTFNRVLRDFDDDDNLVENTTQYYVGGPIVPFEGTDFWLYQIFFEWSSSDVVGIGQLGYAGWTTYDLNDDGDTVDIFLLFTNNNKWIGNHISEVYPESGASTPFTAGGDLDYPIVDTNTASEVSYFWRGVLDEDTDFTPAQDLNNDFDTNDDFDYILKAEFRSQDNSAPFPDATPSFGVGEIDNINAAVFDTNNNGDLSDDTQILNGGTVQFGSGTPFEVTIDPDPCTDDWDIRLNAAMTGTYTVQVLIEGYDDINNNGQIDAGEPPRSAVITVNIIVP